MSVRWIPELPVRPDATQRELQEYLNRSFRSISTYLGVSDSNGGITEAPIDGTPYGRQDADWTKVTGEAPSDGLARGRKDAGWVVVPEEAASDGLARGRKDAGWVLVPEEAASDGVTRGRLNGGWSPVIGEAPQDNKPYSRENAAWVQGVKAGYGGLQLSGSISTLFTITTTRQKVTGYDQNVTPNPVDVTQSLGSQTITVQAGLWFIGAIVAVRCNPSAIVDRKVQLQLVASVGNIGQPMRQVTAVGADEEAFGLTLAGLYRATSQRQLELGIQMLTAASNITVNQADHLAFTAHRVGPA